MNHFQSRKTDTQNVEVVILNQGEDTTFEEDLAQDVLEMITVFSARLYGRRSRKNRKLRDGCQKPKTTARRGWMGGVGVGNALDGRKGRRSQTAQGADQAMAAVVSQPVAQG